MRCIAVIGPSQSGKSTLVARLAALGHGASVTDLGRSVALTRFTAEGEAWGAIDVPGSIEWLGEAHAALLGADAAVVCVGPDPEAAVLAAPYLRAVEAAGTPTLLFLNRMDTAEARVRDIVAALQDYARHPIVLRQVPIRREGHVVGAVDLVSERAWQYRQGQPSALIEIPDTMLEREHEARAGLLEGLAELDDWLLEELVEDREPATGPLYAICTRALSGNQVHPALFGSAAQGHGMTRLLKAIRHEVPGPAALAARLAAACATTPDRVLAAGLQTDHRRHLGKLGFLRALAPGVGPGRRLSGETLGSLLDPSEAGPDGGLEPGAIAGVVKSDHLGAGLVYGADGALGRPDWAAAPPPMLSRVLVALRERDEAKLTPLLARLAADEPGIALTREAGTGRAVVHAQGPVQLRRLIERLAEVHGIETADHPPADSYRETVTRTATTHHRHRKQTGGAGQFADVRLTVAPAPRGAGFVFAETVKGGAVPRNFIPAVEAGARDAMERGPLGFPAVDVAVTLTDGQHHAVDSSEHAFRTAARAAALEAMAAASPVLLQPIRAVTAHIPSVASGALVPIVASLRGQVLGFERDPDAKGWDLFRALLPEAALPDLAQSLRAATHGVGNFEAEFDHYEEVYGKAAERILAIQD